MPGWNSLRNLVEEEFRQSAQEGRNRAAVEALRDEFTNAGDDPAQLRAVWAKVLALPIDDDFPYHEPNDLDAIHSSRPRITGSRALPLNCTDEALFDKLYGAWLGRCCGCALGKPVEHFMSYDPRAATRRPAAAAQRFATTFAHAEPASIR